MTAILEAVDFGEVAAWAGALGVVIIGYTMIFKGVSLGKKGVNKA